ncbi:MAG: LamG domain-containing protein [Verrucomicrobiales bacterium]
MKFVILTLVGAAAAAASAHASVVAYLPLDTNGNEVINAIAPNVANNVTFGVAGATPHTGTAAQFNGTNSVISFGSVGAAEPALNPADSWTLMVWANSLNSPSWGSIITSRDDVPPGGVQRHGYILYEANSSNEYQYWGGTGAANWGAMGSGNTTQNEWQHFTLTYDAGTNLRQFFIDGNLVNSSNLAFSENTLEGTHIGAGGDLGDTFWFNGYIDDLAIHDAVLTPAQIQAAMTFGNTIVPEPSRALLLLLGGIALAARRRRG